MCYRREPRHIALKSRAVYQSQIGKKIERETIKPVQQSLTKSGCSNFNGILDSGHGFALCSTAHMTVICAVPELFLSPSDLRQASACGVHLLSLAKKPRDSCAPETSFRLHIRYVPRLWPPGILFGQMAFIISRRFAPGRRDSSRASRRPASRPPRGRAFAKRPDSRARQRRSTRRCGSDS